MLRPTVVNVKVKNNYILLLEFDNGEEKELNVIRVIVLARYRMIVIL